MMFLAPTDATSMWSAASIPSRDLWLSKQSFWNEQNGSPRELHHATRRFSELVLRLVCGIDAHHDQIGVAGSGDADKLGTRSTAGHDAAPVAPWPRHIADGVVKQLSKMMLDQLSSLVDVRVGPSWPFPLFGKHVNGSHPRVYGRRERKRVIRGYTAKPAGS